MTAKRWYVFNGELLGEGEHDPAEDTENLYVPVVFGPDYDALLAAGEALAECAEECHRLARTTALLLAALRAWREAAGEPA